MKRYDVIVIGAGPAGLSAAAEAAGHGMSVAVFDENERPGGQLFKQIHKFFGSKEHKAKIRGFDIGKELLKEAEDAGAQVFLDAPVTGLYANREIVARIGEEITHFKGDSIIVATGASENMLNFEGWTLPGVMGAGAAQTMMSINMVKPGKRVLMLGSGNVGLVVGFQLLQAGCELAAVVDASPKIGGYGVHAAKLARTGVPFYLSHTIVKAEGTEHVEGVVIAEVDNRWKIIPGAEKTFDVDTVCIAVGLSASAKLLTMVGCEMREASPGAGYLPVCDDTGMTSVDGIYVCGDVSGIEEASSAMIEGRIAGVSAAGRLGFAAEDMAQKRIEELKASLSALHEGMFAPKNKGKVLEKTDEGLDLSESLLKKGYLADDEVEKYPGVKHAFGVHPVIECTQNIPCNPCQDSCPKGCIKVSGSITALPVLDETEACLGCGQCVAACSGQCIFLVENVGGGSVFITIPYEFVPYPQAGDVGTALDRSGAPLCPARMLSFKMTKSFDRTGLLTFSVPYEFSSRARFWIPEGSERCGDR